jgi:hypothetical protein
MADVLAFTLLAGLLEMMAALVDSGVIKTFFTVY